MMTLRLVGPILLALVTAYGIDRIGALRGLRPPFHRDRFGSGEAAIPVPMGAFRRALSAAGLAAVLWIGVFGPLGLIGQETVEVDLSTVPMWKLFELHAVFLLFVVGWYVVGFVPRGALDRDRRERGWSFAAQLGFLPTSQSSSSDARERGSGGRLQAVVREIGIGLLLGVAGWLAVLTVLVLLGSLIWIIGGEDALPSQPPAMVNWMAALPWTIRLGISFSAGFVEETFFRGLLQPRCGIALSTILFAIAHAGYEQPLMLVGVTLLSLFFSMLVVWRQNIVAAITAHTLFDAVQLLIVVPSVTEVLGAGEGDGLGDLVSFAGALLVGALGWLG